MLIKGEKYNSFENRSIAKDDLTIIMNFQKIQMYLFNKKSTLKLNIIKSTSLYSDNHLDIYFEGVEFSKRYSGLIGDIANKKYEIFYSIQKGGHQVMLVDDQLIKSKMSRRTGNDCQLIDLESLIHPKKYNDYIY